MDQTEKGAAILSKQMQDAPWATHSTQPKPTVLRQERSGQTREKYKQLRVRRSRQHIQSNKELKQKAKLNETITSVYIQHKKELFSITRTKKNSNKYNDFRYS